MLNDLLSPTVQHFVREHERDDVKTLLLKHRDVNGVPMGVVADQITGRKKAKEKIPLLYETEGIVYPPGINLEQSSSQKTALFKNRWLNFLASKNLCVDLTGGFGIDSLFFSHIFAAVHYVEPNHNLLTIVQHNHRQLKAVNITHHPSTAEDFLLKFASPTSDVKGKADLVYIDPSRRNKANQKVFSLTECEPDITLLQSSVFEITDHLLVKTSPLLDLQQGLKELKHVKNIVVVAVENECKEVLFFCERNFSGEAVIETVNMMKNDDELFSFSLSEEREAAVIYGEPLQYLYEPNAAILKAGAFKSIAQKFQLHKLHASTHLYTASTRLDFFPGRIFEIVAHVKPSAKLLSPFFPEGKANITTRNYPLSVDELKKKTGLSDGGHDYLIGFSGQKEKFLVAAKRLR
ncbi:THUMP-like domain-containing protein [Chryseolinea lacunae]|uniref:SAM-dependent methyltransferase n=1 Tax=Chryseolinea lacunae TaxID=2801331 RepID=A0ABS1KQN4_9BACT|nr:SAM-dependent methyltransferase [Chryseolinea lacunae]MBL0741780.1 SAM-dependent methyltransferase [Chryseolinea lacunae]